MLTFAMQNADEYHMVHKLSEHVVTWLCHGGHNEGPVTPQEIPD
jgi:hypothetical protein